MTMINAETSMAGVIGWPIRHSRSPLIHNAWCKRYDINGVYTALPVHPDSLADVINALPHMGFKGANVTIPHKQAVLPLVDVLDDAAKAIDAVNTLVFDTETSQITGYNTDAEGFWDALQHTYPNVDFKDQPVTVLGAGGAAKAVLYQLNLQDFSDIRVAVRDMSKARQAVATLSSTFHFYDMNDGKQLKEALQDSTLVINTTPLGMAGYEPLNLPLSVCASQAIIYDLIYVPYKTELLKQAEAQGFKTLNGLRMLLYQAVIGFELWFGLRPTVDDALENVVVADLNTAV